MIILVWSSLYLFLCRMKIKGSDVCRITNSVFQKEVLHLPKYNIINVCHFLHKHITLLLFLLSLTSFTYVTFCLSTSLRHYFCYWKQACNTCSAINYSLFRGNSLFSYFYPKFNPTLAVIDVFQEPFLKNANVRLGHTSPSHSHSKNVSPLSHYI